MRTLVGIWILGQMVLAVPSLSQESARSSGTRLPIEFLLGGVGALAGGLGGARLGAAIIGPRGGEDPGVLGAVIGLVLGAPLGTAAGVFVGARADDPKAQFGSALGGAGVGLATFLLLGGVTGLDPDQGTFWVGFFGLPLMGAVLSEELGLRRRNLRVEVVPGRRGLRLGVRVGF